MFPYMQQPLFFGMPPQAPKPRKRRHLQRELYELIQSEEFKEYMKKKMEDKGKKDDKKPEEKKGRTWSAFEVATIMMLLSPGIGVGMLQFYVYCYNAAKLSLQAIGAN